MLCVVAPFQGGAYDHKNQTGLAYFGPALVVPSFESLTVEVIVKPGNPY
jgi:hypothetical protein